MKVDDYEFMMGLAEWHIKQIALAAE